jgi:soluble P-type ATPase
MLEITIPGYKELHLDHLVLDFNGTLACDGRLLKGVRDILNTLSCQLDLHVVTADTFGTAKRELAAITCTFMELPPEHQDAGKLAYINRLGAHRTIAIGNGRNDRLMLRESALGIAVIQGEGAWVETVMAADIVTFGILDALNLIANPRRLIATLRS